jgi:acetyl esterase/lipase
MLRSKYLSFVLFLALALSCSLKAQLNNSSEDYSALMPEIQAYNKSLKPMPDFPLTPEVVKIVRKILDKPVKTVLQPYQKEIDGQNGKIGLRIFKPEKIDAVYLWIHGGGHLWGSAASDDSLNDITARTCNVAVVSVEYKLAPENPWPAQPTDCYAAAKWLLNNSQADFGTGKILIGGGSAGAHLSALTAIYIRDSLKAIDRVMGVNLQYGLYDLGLTPSHRAATSATLGLNKHILDEIMRVVFGKFTVQQLQSPGISPLFADLRNLPPAFFTIGSADALADDTYFMEARWRSAGNKTYLAIYPDCIHGFNTVHMKISTIANDKMNAWMKQLITGKPAKRVRK